MSLDKPHKKPVSSITEKELQDLEKGLIDNAKVYKDFFKKIEEIKKRKESVPEEVEP